MVLDIKVVGLDKTQKYLASLQIEVPKALVKDAKKIAFDFRKGLKNEIMAQDLMWHGLLKNSVKIKKTGEGKFSVFVRDYGIMLDSMRTHWVVVKGKPILEQWAEENLGEIPYKIKVRKQPWIKAGLERGRKRIKERIAKGNVIRVIKGGFI